MLYYADRIKEVFLKYRVPIFSILSFAVPFIIYILTLERKLVGGDTTWYALQLPIMQVMVPTGYPAFSIIGKLFSIIPVGELSYRLNLISAVFGALTILFVFLAINKLVKNVIISFAASLTFAFLFDYWTVANRLEFDTLNSFFIALILFAMFSYAERPERKKLYFFAAALGLSLTNHPLAFFIMPAFILYIILVKPDMFKNVKAVFTGILFFLMPLTLYGWLPVRSLQGYGPVTTLKNFVYYITGRNVDGRVHGSTFNHWDIKSFATAGKQFIEIIYSNLGPLLLIIALLGIIYLFRKNWRLAVSSIFLIFLNLLITILYLGWMPANYTLNTLIIISIYISYGFLFIYDRITGLFKKAGYETTYTRSSLKNKGRPKRIKIFNYFVITILFIFFMASPALLAAKNYKEADRSEPLEIYNFWERIFDHAEGGSVIYVVSSSSNIGEFINIYERPDKKVTLITHKDERYTPEDVIKNLEEGKKVYFVNIEEELIAAFNVKEIFRYRWERMDEPIVFYEYGGKKKDINITHDFEQEYFSFGEKLEIEYRIINDNDEDAEITSIELSLSDNLDFLGVDRKAAINLEPSMWQGKYMWVKTFPVRANDYINIILVLQCASPGKAEIDFRITSQDTYFETEKIEFDISSK